VRAGRSLAAATFMAPNISLRRLNDLRTRLAGNVVILERGGRRAVQHSHAVRFGDLLRVSGATIRVFKHALILRRTPPPDNRAEVQAGDATVLERGGCVFCA
jgi:hypothetical protein